LGADVTAHHAFLYPLGQSLEHFTPFCPVLVCILSKIYCTIFNERINEGNDDDDDDDDVAYEGTLEFGDWLCL